MTKEEYSVDQFSITNEQVKEEIEKLYDVSLKYNAIIYMNEDMHDMADEMFYKYKENIKSYIAQLEQENLKESE